MSCQEKTSKSVQKIDAWIAWFHLFTTHSQTHTFQLIYAIRIVLFFSCVSFSWVVATHWTRVASLTLPVSISFYSTSVLSVEIRAYNKLYTQHSPHNSNSYLYTLDFFTPCEQNAIHILLCVLFFFFVFVFLFILYILFLFFMTVLNVLYWCGFDQADRAYGKFVYFVSHITAFERVACVFIET